jgi:hypothetical protein
MSIVLRRARRRTPGPSFFRRGKNLQVTDADGDDPSTTSLFGLVSFSVADVKAPELNGTPSQAEGLAS